MPYSYSTSRTAASQRVKDLRASFVHTQKCTKKIRSDVRQLVFQHCVIQVVAIFEDYISDILSQWFYRLGVAGANAEKLPMDLRLHALANALAHNYRVFVGDDDEVRLVGKMKKKISIIKSIPGQTPVTEVDFVDLLVSKKTFPSEKNFDKLFARLGIPKMSAMLTKRLKSGDFLVALDAVMGVRNALAHQFPPPITELDVKRYLDNLERWLNALDREIYSHIVKSSGEAFWA